MTGYDEALQREILLAAPHMVEQRRSLDGVQLRWKRAAGGPGLVQGGGAVGAILAVLGGIIILYSGISGWVDPGAFSAPWWGVFAGGAVAFAGLPVVLVWLRRRRARVTLSSAGIRVDDGPVLPFGSSFELEFLLHDRSGVARASREVMEANRTDVVKGSTSSGLDVIIDGERIEVARLVTADQALVLADALAASWPEPAPPELPQTDAEQDELDALNQLRAGAKAGEKVGR